MKRISQTGIGHGWGSDPYKWVSHLTAEERTAVKNGQLILVTDCPTHAGNPSFRAVVYANGRFTHRIPDAVSLFSALDAGELETLRAEIETGWVRPARS